MENSAEEQVASKYNDSAADAVAVLAILTIVIAAVVFWVAGQ
jgi:hypothetical protein